MVVYSFEFIKKCRQRDINLNYIDKHDLWNKNIPSRNSAHSSHCVDGHCSLLLDSDRFRLLPLHLYG